MTFHVAFFSYYTGGICGSFVTVTGDLTRGHIIYLFHRGLRPQTRRISQFILQRGDPVFSSWLITLRRPHNGSCNPPFLSVDSTFPTSSMSLSPVDMLLKAEVTLEFQEENAITKQNSVAMTGLELPHTSLGRRSSRSSTRNQRGRASDKRERSCFPCVSWSSVASSTKLPSSDAASTCTTSSSFNTSSCCCISASCPSVVPSPMDRSRRSPSPGSCPEMTTQSSCAMHTFSVTLQRSILPEMITVSAKKGDRLDVVADAWHMERDCEFNLFNL